MSNRELSQIQDNITKILDHYVSEREILDGIPLSNIAVATTPTIISHKLGRTPLGYIITSKNGPGDIWDTARDSKTITLTSSAAVTCAIWVY